jgi:phosphopantothenoylcysteine decarboxylase/phosphopantothenate--cysteine ligase
MRVLVTAGPTREFVDDVRFVSNPSSGKTGFALAAEAARRGHEVTLVSGPVALTPPRGVRFVPVVSAREMLREVLRRARRIDAVLMTAAVSDYAPRRVRGKIKKTRSPMILRMNPTPDVLKALGRRKGRATLVGFALESGDELANAVEKLKAKRLDLIVSNGPATFGSERIRATLIARDGSVRALPPMKKEAFAKRLLSVVERLRA